MVYLLAGWFAVIGNGSIMFYLLRKNPMLIGGSLSHVGFGVLLIGILASSAYNETLLDQSTVNYNASVERGEAVDEQGFPVRQKVNFLELKLNKSKIINGEYLVTYEGYTMENQERPGQQQYKIRFQSAEGGKDLFTLHPQVYPMNSGGSGAIQWSVDPDVRTGLFSDIYLYVAGSSFVEQINERNEKVMQAASQDEESADSSSTQKIVIGRGETISLGGFDISFQDYIKAETSEIQQLPDSTMIAIRARLNISQKASGESTSLNPLFAIYNKDGKSWAFTPPQQLTNDIGIQFTQVKPESGEIELTVTGIDEKYEDEWVLLVAEEKPFISVVWLGTFLLMIGFSVAIFRHWDRERKKPNS